MSRNATRRSIKSSAAITASRASRKAPRTRRGAALQIGIGLIAAGALVWSGIASVTSSTSTTRLAASKRLKFRFPSTPIEIEAALGELGLTPHTLAASGLSAQQTSAFTAAAAGYIRTNIADYRAAQDAAFQARGEVNRLTRLVQGGVPSAEQLTALSAAQSSLSTAQAQRQSFLNAALAEGTSAVTGIPLLNTVRVNHRLWDIPAQYLADNRSESQWVNLRDALANDRISLSLDQDPDPASHQLLLNAQTTTNAAAALSNLNNLPEIQNAWNAAINP